MKRAAPTTAVVFDLDGPLVDSLPLVLSAIAHAIEPFGPVRPTMEIFARLGGPPERFMPGLLDDPRNVAAALERMETYHHANHHLIRPFEDVTIMLERLREQKVACAIWTGRDRESTDWLLAHHNLAPHFSTVVCGDDLPTHKPDPAGLFEILRRLAIPAAHAVFVGDADVDVLGGAACDVDTLLIRHGRQVDQDVSAKAWHSVACPQDAYRVVLDCIGDY